MHSSKPITRLNDLSKRPVLVLDLDVGASTMIAEGKIKMRQGHEIGKSFLYVLSSDKYMSSFDYQQRDRV